MNAPTPTELILLPSLNAQRGPRGGLVLTRKYLEGASEFAHHWPGRVTSLIEMDDRPTGDFDRVEVMPSDSDTAIEERPRSPADLAQRLASAAVVLGFLSPYEAGTAALCRRLGVPAVFTSEYSPKTERQIIDAEVRNPIRRLRRKQWAWQAERTRQKMLRDAAGLQCSGTPTYDLYRGLNNNTLLFFDNRVPADRVVDDQVLAEKAASLAMDRPLRLVFGGRLVAMKGALELLEVAARLAASGTAFSLTIVGDGPLAGEMHARVARLGLGDRVRIDPPLDFRLGWLPLLRREADLFLCCHPQGDPSSTYPEVMSCGVPIAGYGNEALAGILARSGGGWQTPVGDAGALAARLVQLDRTRQEISTAARRARDFAREHTFETTFARRTAHLLASSRQPSAAS